MGPSQQFQATGSMAISNAACLYPPPSKIAFKLARLKENLCGSDLTGLNSSIPDFHQGVYFNYLVNMMVSGHPFILDIPQ